MSALEDHADRLLHLANTIRNTTQAREGESTTSGPFARAVLETPLGDLIRDVDPSEIGLFNLVTPRSSLTHPNSTTNNPSASVNIPQKAEITRVALPIATPLRKPPSSTRRREGGQRITEHDPEVYLNAATKLLDRYQSVRPMPRFVERVETLRDRVEAVRESIKLSNEKLKQLNESSVEAVETPEARIKAEEHRIAEVQSKIEELKKQKEALLSKKRPGGRLGARTTFQSRYKQPAPEPTPAVSQADAQEEDFWNTPGAPVRTLRFTGDLLTNEQMDISSIDPSLSSPLTYTSKPSRGVEPSTAMQFKTRKSFAPIDKSTQDGDSFEDSIVGSSNRETRDEEEEVEDDDDVTVMLNKSPPRHEASEDGNNQPPPLPESESISTILDSHTPGETKARTRFKITTELETIVAKIWSCMGDTIMPGQASKPLRAKETIAHLQSLSAESPSTDSPSATSLSSLATAQTGGGPPTTQQIHTARILLALLSAPPAYALPLNSLKEVLSQGGGVGVGTRPIYACVAKRLLKIERGGGEQVVKFDV